MKKFTQEFLRRGLIACGFGPIVLAILYLILERSAGLETLTVKQVCTGILSLSALAFIAGGMNAIYQIERLPLAAAILIHGSVLYIGYLAAYLVNGWLESGAAPVMVFTGVFIVGYIAVWAIIYFTTRRRTTHLNALLAQKRRADE